MTISSLQKFRSISMAAISAYALCMIHPIESHADLATLIQEYRSGLSAVITSTPGSSSDDGYGILTMPVADFAQKLNLTDPSQLENSYFKIVAAETDDSLPTTDFDGSNVLYHLMLAREFYSRLAQNSGFPDEALDPSTDRKVVVRIRMENAYNLVLHFAKEPDYNNSRYIPAEARMIQMVNAGERPEIKPWNQEIWFDHQKASNQKVDLYQLLTSAGMAAVTQNWMALGATPMQFLDNHNSGIDGAKIPDVIYHEAFHYASDAEGLFPMASEGNPVAEDYANYFGSSLNGRPVIAEIDEFSSRAYKRNYSKVQEVKNSIPEPYNANPFGPSILWQIRNRLGQERADQLIWNSLHELNGSILHTDVPVALSAAAHQDAALSAEEIAAIDGLLEKYNQSYVNLELKFNPGEKTILDKEKLAKVAEEQAERLNQVPNELRSSGVEVDDETSQNVATAIERLKAQTRKPGFRSKVVSMLNKIAKVVKISAEDSGKAIGFAGDAIYAAGNAPMTFGTDLLSSIILGHGMITENQKTLQSEISGAAGGVAATYYAYTGLAALGFSSSNIVTSSAMGVVFVNSKVCSKATPEKPALYSYCIENTKFLNAINTDTAKGGATIGSKVHGELKMIGRFFKKVFTGN